MRVAAEIAKLRTCLLTLSPISAYINQMLPKVEGHGDPDFPAIPYVGFCFLVIGKLREKNLPTPVVISEFMSLFMRCENDPAPDDMSVYAETVKNLGVY